MGSFFSVKKSGFHDFLYEKSDFLLRQRVNAIKREIKLYYVFEGGRVNRAGQITKFKILAFIHLLLGLQRRPP